MSQEIERQVVACGQVSNLQLYQQIKRTLCIEKKLFSRLNLPLYEPQYLVISERYSFMVYKIFTLTLLFLATSAISLTACRSANTEKQEISVGGHNFAIPRNYLIAWENAPYPPEKGQAKGKVNFQLLLPKLKPYTIENKKVFEGSEAPLITINLHTISNDLSPSKIYNSYDLSSWLAKKLHESKLKDGSSEYAEPVSTGFGLIKYASRKAHAAGNDLYVLEEEGKTIFVISCSRESDWENPLCKMDRTILGTLNLHYRFPKTFISSAVEIDRNVEKLITSFIIWEKTP